MHVRRSLALIAALPLLLAGCSGEAEPTPKMPDPTTSSATPTQTPTESETAEVESAEDFIRRWSEALREMQVTGETQSFRELGPRCESCSETADRVEQIYTAGGVIEWEGWTIISIDAYGSSDTEFRVVERSAPTRFRESSSSEWQRLDGGRTPHVFDLEPAGGSWVVTRTAELAE